jgi:hypothetical protein
MWGRLLRCKEFDDSMAMKSGAASITSFLPRKFALSILLTEIAPRQRQQFSMRLSCVCIVTVLAVS